MHGSRAARDAISAQDCEQAQSLWSRISFDSHCPPGHLVARPTSLATTSFACTRGILSAAPRAMYEENNKDAILRKRTILTARRGNMLEEWCPLLSAFYIWQGNKLFNPRNWTFLWARLFDPAHIFSPEFFRQVSDELVIRVIQFVCRV